MVIKAVKEDIKTYLTWKIDTDIDRDAMNNELKDKIMRRIPDTMSEIFLLVWLNIDAILAEPIHRRREKLNQMIDGFSLGGAYDSTLERIQKLSGSKLKLAITALIWVCHSERPPPIDELRYMLGVEIGSLDINLDDIPSTRTLLGCCLGLVTTGKNSKLRLIHFTLQGYLSTHPLLAGAHSRIAEITLTYLNYRFVHDFATGESACIDLTLSPFLRVRGVEEGVEAVRKAQEYLTRKAKYNGSETCVANEYCVDWSERE
ncbi:hypothetical protein L873DRAFT_1788873 [Choiromyces venosus 120613-1]|uniref:GPI inositol-deacylase winged helix domain-containing protein n=1 Tax=Choiromyces venosus 120613-1 TaxID=1336337 RepID=A0A3N4JR09_9PEZI|nr:hypothetical protein L873DRAFT_1788873 [Choiromyces venosus 120613-1]